MVDMGAEVGQKMRSAIKAKLTELDCYVDDELPDYIMVMIANQRSKNEMNNDLNLFLKTKTSTFVDWLHIVLKKLKEVTVTNPEIYKKALKKKSSHVKLKKEKRDKKIKTEKIKEEVIKDLKEEKTTSLTDDLPINAKNLNEQRRVLALSSQVITNNQNINNFDIPSMSSITSENDEEIYSRTPPLKNIHSRLGEVQNDKEVNLNAQSLVEKKINKSSNEQIKFSKNLNIIDPQQLSLDKQTETKVERTKIVFSKSDFENKESTKKSVMNRLGKRLHDDKKDKEYFKRKRRNSTEESPSRIKSPVEKFGNSHRKRSRSLLRTEIKKNKSVYSDLRKTLTKSKVVASDAKDNIKKRLGVQSKIFIPEEIEEEKLVKKDVVSVIKVKPRVMPPSTSQANKNLLLKAVADAQKSVAQTKLVGRKVEEKEDINSDNDLKSNVRKIPPEAKEILRNFLFNHRLGKVNIIEDNNEEKNLEYVPQPIKTTSSNIEYVPSSKEETNGLDYSYINLQGIEKSKISVKSRLDGRKTPSPIIFNKPTVEPVSTEKKVRNIPDTLPTVPYITGKNKERCKYWPDCKNGDKCDFLHPEKYCEAFPYCKFGAKCLFLHPLCKFGSSCTKRDCAYSHSGGIKSVKAITSLVLNSSISSQTCKFLQNCANSKCPYYHPKLCKFGKFCKNPLGCGFRHTNFPKNSNLAWKLQ